MYLMYLGNTDVVSAQISKVHSHLGSSACCQLLSIELFHDRATLFLMRLMSFDETNVSTFDMLSFAHQLGR